MSFLLCALRASARGIPLRRFWLRLDGTGNSQLDLAGLGHNTFTAEALALIVRSKTNKQKGSPIV